MSQLSQQFKRHPFFKGKQIIAVEKLHGGLNHAVHKVVTDNMTVVTRTANFPHSEFSERHIQQLLAEQNITPNVLYADDNSTILTFVEGLHPTPRRLNTKQLSQLADLIGSVHQYAKTDSIDRLTLLPYIKRMFDTAKLSAEQKAIAQQGVEQLEQLNQFPYNEGLCHTDLNPLNIIDDGKRFWLIDWESAALCDVAFDLASFIIEHQLDEQAQQQFLKHYHEKTLRQQQNPQKLKLMKIAYCLICWLWYLKRQQDTSTQIERTDWFLQQLLQLIQGNLR